MKIFRTILPRKEISKLQIYSEMLSMSSLLEMHWNNEYLTPYHYKIITADMSLEEQNAYDDFRKKFFQSRNKSESPSIHQRSENHQVY